METVAPRLRLSFPLHKFHPCSAPGYSQAGGREKDFGLLCVIPVPFLPADKPGDLVFFILYCSQIGRAHV